MKKHKYSAACEQDALSKLAQIKRAIQIAAQERTKLIKELNLAPEKMCDIPEAELRRLAGINQAVSISLSVHTANYLLESIERIECGESAKAAFGLHPPPGNKSTRFRDYQFAKDAEAKGSLSYFKVSTTKNGDEQFKVGDDVLTRSGAEAALSRGKDIAAFAADIRDMSGDGAVGDYLAHLKRDE